MTADAVVQTPDERRVPISTTYTGPRAGLNRLSALTQALDLKTQAYADALAKDTPVHVRAALMRAWADLHEITMAIRGEGKPKPVEARNATRKRKGRDAAAPIVSMPRAHEEPQAPSSTVNGAS